MENIGTLFGSIKRMRWRVFIQQCINFGLVVCSALMIWKGLMIVTGSESPIVVVLSGSMRPAFERGDLLLLVLDDAPLRVGDIPVFQLDQKEIPIVHRVLRVHEKANGEVDLLTKGDNNTADDRGLYARGQLFIQQKHILGKAKGFLPFIGMVTILMNDYPMLKWGMIAMLGFFVLVNRGEQTS